MIADESAAAALADICCLAAGGTGGQNCMRRIIVRQSVSHCRNVSVAADGTFLDRIAGTGTGWSYIKSTILMLALGCVFHFGQAAAGADIQHFTVHLAGGLPN